jgi:hypothetical protein
MAAERVERFVNTNLMANRTRADLVIEVRLPVTIKIHQAAAGSNQSLVIFPKVFFLVRNQS